MLEEVVEAEKSSLKNEKGDGERIEEGGGLFGVDLGNADDGVNTSGEGFVPDEQVGRGLHDGCTKGKDGFFAKSCNYWISKGGRM